MNRIILALFVIALACLLPACADEPTAEEYLESGRELVEGGQYWQAVADLKAALNKNVDLVEARALLGRAYYETGDIDSADKELSRALKSGHQVDRDLLIPLLAQTLLRTGDYDRLEALEIDGLSAQSSSTTLAAKGLAVLYQGEEVVAEDIIRTAVATSPESLYARLAAARLSIEKREYERALEQLDSILEEAPDYAAAWNLVGDIEAAQRRLVKATQAYSKVLEIAPGAFDARLNRAMMHIYRGKFKNARNDLAVLSRRHRGAAAAHPGVSFTRGITLLEAGRLQSARKAFEKTVDSSYQYPLSYYYMAVIDLQEGMLERALTEIYRFLALAPESIAGPKLAARLELEQGGYFAAENLLRPVLESWPDDIESLNMLANALIGQGRGGEGIEVLARVVELQPESSQARARLGAGYFATGKIDSGIAVLKDAVRDNPQFEQADILIVLNYLRADKVVDAIAAAKAYRDRNPGRSEAYNLLGRAYLAADKLKQASSAFRTALEITPADPAARHGLAEIALRHENYHEARQYYRKVLKYHENRLQTQLKIAAAYALEGREQELLNYLRLAIDSHPEAAEPRLVLARYYMGAGRLEEAETTLDQLSSTQQDRPDALATLASFQLASERYHQALRTLGRLLIVRPAAAQYHYMRSKAYAGLGESEQMVSDLQRAIELDPDHFYAKLAMARLTLALGNHKQFNEHLRELKEVAPQNPDVIQLEAAAAQRRGDHALAEELFQQLYKREPTSANLIELAMQRYLMGNFSAAVALLEQWVGAHPKDTRAREKLATMYEQQGHSDQVVNQYRAIVSTESDNVVALNNLAWYLLDIDPSEALRYAQRAYTLSPGSASILDTLAMAQMKNDQPEAARRTLQRALELAPGSPEMRFHEAKLLAASGHRQSAVALLNSLLGEHGDFAQREDAEAFLRELQ